MSPLRVTAEGPLVLDGTYAAQKGVAFDAAVQIVTKVSSLG